MTTKNLAVLALLIFFGPSAAHVFGQVPVRDVASLTVGQRVRLVTRGLLAPRGLADYATLQAYPEEYVCGASPNWPNPPSEVHAPAALIVQEEGGFSATYTLTVREAFWRAQGLCNQDDGNIWYIGTTAPVAGFEPERQFFSADAQGIAEQLARPRISTAAAMTAESDPEP